ncbi:hypothetical protein Leryth_025203 [Lithospermum erythrorhizon]|uniref:Uncharacterized protein n=1 Tax=Lithospermum erythrorhizon TaxID=34254 RepID=A0AAV3RTN6_LITER|nr:hypothetical protein Leryth_025203 [Lithospermum erythrorhizon]
MGLFGRLMKVDNFSKKQGRSLYWRIKAAVKKAVKNARKQQFKFQYDPSSYALNFDDGCYEWAEKRGAFHLVKFHECSHISWVYVVLVETKHVH